MQGGGGGGEGKNLNDFTFFLFYWSFSERQRGKHDSERVKPLPLTSINVTRVTSLKPLPLTSINVTRVTSLKPLPLYHSLPVRLPAQQSEEVDERSVLSFSRPLHQHLGTVGSRVGAVGVTAVHDVLAPHPREHRPHLGQVRGQVQGQIGHQLSETFVQLPGRLIKAGADRQECRQENNECRQMSALKQSRVSTDMSE